MTLTPEQIEERKSGVGCSEILSALGKDDRCSRLELYLRKTGEIDGPNFDNNARVQMGNLLEPVIRDGLIAPRLGHQIIVPERTLRHGTHPLVGHPDGWIESIREGVEVKTADKHEAEEFGEPESDQVPLRYLVQCAGYMALTGADKWHLGVLIGGNDFRMYEIPRDAEIEKAVLEGVGEFWKSVETRTPPDPETPADMALRWPKSLQGSVSASSEIDQLTHEHAACKAEIKRLETDEQSLRAQIQKFMGEHGDLVGPDGKTIATWRSNKDGLRLNEKKLEDDHVEIYEQYLEPRKGARPFLNKLIKEYLQQ